MCPGNERRMRPCTPGPYRDNNVAVSVEAPTVLSLVATAPCLTATITSRSPLKLSQYRILDDSIFGLPRQ